MSATLIILPVICIEHWGSESWRERGVFANAADARLVCLLRNHWPEIRDALLAAGACA